MEKRKNLLDSKVWEAI